MDTLTNILEDFKILFGRSFLRELLKNKDGFLPKEGRLGRPKDEIPELDIETFNKLPGIKEKILYLSIRGWSCRIEKRKEKKYLYAIKYISRVKYRIYLGTKAAFNEITEGGTPSIDE